MKAYHFLNQNMRSGFGDEPAWTVGEERTWAGKTLKLCERGYHHSPSPYDALQYAPGSMLCEVEVSKPVEQDASKGVSWTRKLLSARDISVELRIFACDCAERALLREREAGREPDPSTWDALRVARLYADGKASKGELMDAADAV